MVGRHGGAAVSIGHPDRKRLLSPIDFKFDVRNLVNSVPARDGQFPAAEKRMERVTHGYDARVAGIIACRFLATGALRRDLAVAWPRIHATAQTTHGIARGPIGKRTAPAAEKAGWGSSAARRSPSGRKPTNLYLRAGCALRPAPAGINPAAC